RGQRRRRRPLWRIVDSQILRGKGGRDATNSSGKGLAGPWLAAYLVDFFHFEMLISSRRALATQIRFAGHNLGEKRSLWQLPRRRGASPHPATPSRRGEL